MIDLAVTDDGFVLSGGNLDPLEWKVDGSTAAFKIENDANVMARDQGR